MANDYYAGNLTPNQPAIVGGGEGGTTAPRFSINNGNKNAQGAMDILDYSTTNILAFKVDDGTTYEPLLATDGYSGTQFTKTSLASISMNTENVSEGTYNVFIPKTGNQPYLLNNVIFVQAEKPTDTSTDTIPNMTSNTTPYGAITFENATTSDTVLGRAYLSFKQGIVPTGTNGYPFVPNGSSSQSSYIIYTYDESQQPQAGLYQFKYQDITSSGSNRAKIYTIKAYTTDGNYVQVASRNGSVDGFSANFTVTLPIAYIKIEVRGTGTSGVTGAFQILKPAILDEGTIWVNNGVEPLEVQSRDANAQWQPFYDVLAGTCTVNGSETITAVSNIDFNYFSTVNMHNISTTAHEDIRNDIDTINATKASKFTAQNPALTPDANNKVTWIITNSLNTADAIVYIRKVSDNSVVSADVTVTVTASSITITMNAESDVSANTYRVVIIG